MSLHREKCCKEKTFTKLTQLLDEVNAYMALYQRAAFEIRQEYAVAYVKYILDAFLEAAGMFVSDFVHGKGKHKTAIQRLYDKVYCR